KSELEQIQKRKSDLESLFNIHSGEVSEVRGQLDRLKKEFDNSSNIYYGKTLELQAKEKFYIERIADLDKELAYKQSLSDLKPILDSQLSSIRDQIAVKENDLREFNRLIDKEKNEREKDMV